MNATKLRLTNILGIDEIEIHPGMVTLIEGRNAAGKTSILEALKSLFAGGSDVTLLRNGAEKGEIALELSDGMEISRRVTASGSTLSVTHPEYGKLPKPQSIVDKLAEIAAVNPVHFLSLPAKKRVEYLLEVCPVRVEHLELVGIVGPEIANNAWGNDLELIDSARKLTYDARTAVNATAKEKRITAAQLAETLPEDRAELERDYDRDIEEAKSACGTLTAEKDAALDAIRRNASHGILDIGRECTEVKDSAFQSYDLQTAEIDREIRALQERRAAIVADKADRLNRIDVEHRERQQRINEEALAAQTAKREEFAPRIAEAEAHYTTLVETRKHIESHRMIAAKVEAMHGEAIELEKQSARLTSKLENLDALKSAKLEALPVKGLEIRDGDLFYNDVPFDRLNTATRLDIAFELAALRTGELKLMFIDGAECLDSESLAHLEARARAEGVQLLISRVTNNDLAVTTEEAIAA